MIIKMLRKKYIWIAFVLVIIALSISYYAITQIRISKFENMIDTHFSLLVNGDYDKAVDLIYYKTEHLHMKDFYLQHLKANGTHVTGYEIAWTKHIGMGIYQSFVYVLDDYDNDILYCTFFKENGEWQMAFNQYMIPEKYQSNQNLEIDDRVLPPDTTIIGLS